MSVAALADRWEQEEAKPRSTADDSVALYLDEAGRYPLLSRAEEMRLTRLVAAGDQTAKRRLVESNLRLVVVIARRYRGLGLDLLDLIQEGNLGLIAAVERYDGRPDVKFATYASWWIRRGICRALSTRSRLVRLPSRLAESTSKVKKAERELAQELGRRPSSDEVARRAGVSADVVADLRRAELAPVSLSEPFGDDGTSLDDLLEDGASTDPSLSLAGVDETASVLAALSALGGRHRRIVELRYGLEGHEPRTLAETADELGISRERLRRLEIRILHLLAARPELQALRPAA
jgi:RNA polymerase primary sigma factor